MNGLAKRVVLEQPVLHGKGQVSDLGLSQIRNEPRASDFRNLASGNLVVFFASVKYSDFNEIVWYFFGGVPTPSAVNCGRNGNLGVGLGSVPVVSSRFGVRGISGGGLWGFSFCCFLPSALLQEALELA